MINKLLQGDIRVFKINIFYYCPRALRVELFNAQVRAFELRLRLEWLNFLYFSRSFPITVTATNNWRSTYSLRPYTSVSVMAFAQLLAVSTITTLLYYSSPPPIWYMFIHRVGVPREFIYCNSIYNMESPESPSSISESLLVFIVEIIRYKLIHTNWFPFFFCLSVHKP